MSKESLVFRFSFAIVNDTLDIFTAILVAIVYVVRITAWKTESLLLEYRTKRGYRIDQYEKKLDDWQIEKMALQLKMTLWERDKLDRIGETVVLQLENFPNLSRRQAKAVLDTHKILMKVSKKPSRRH